MRTTIGLAVLSISLVALACGRPSTETDEGALSEELTRDLAVASAAAVELAGAESRRLHFVSARERTPTSAPRRATPRRSPRPRAAYEEGTAESPSGEPATEVALAEADSPSPEQPSETARERGDQSADESDAPAPSSRPAPMPVPDGMGDEPRRGGGGWGVVVIRGGSTGDDHCELHRRPRGRAVPTTVILINDRFPVTTTFPRHNTGSSLAFPR